MAIARTPDALFRRQRVVRKLVHVGSRSRQMKAEYVEKQKEYEAKKARAKALKLRLTCTICAGMWTRW